MKFSLRYFVLISLVMVAIMTFFASNYLVKFIITTTIEKPLQAQHLAIARHYTAQLWCRFSPMFDRLKGSDVISWQKDDEFNKFSRLSTTLLYGVGASKITLYTEKGSEFFTTRKGDAVFFEGAPVYTPTDTSVTMLIPQMGIYGDNGNLKKGSYLYSRTLITSSDCKTTTALPTTQRAFIEIFTDTTPPIKSLFWLKVGVIMSILFIFTLFYIALYIASKKTERIINKQHEEKLSLERAKLQAESQNQEKSMFLANVSHELRTPLNAIIGFSEIIKDETMGPIGHPQYSEYIHDINTSGIHLLSLINDILDYSKAEARKLDVESIDVDLTKIAHSCLRLVEPRANEAHVTLVENVPDRRVILTADAKRMKQIVLNLLSNAIKFTAENGKVTLVIKEDILEETVQLSVTDTGIGIAPKDISKAMSPFGQIDSSLSRRFEGTGLGLPLTKKLTELMGGKFDIKSEVGVGTSIILTFPVKKVKPPKADKSSF